MNFTTIPSEASTAKNTLVWGMHPAHLALL